MDLHSKLDLAPQAPSLDGPERLLLAQVAELVDPDAVRALSVVDCSSGQFFDELARLCPNAQITAFADALVAESEVRAHAMDSPELADRVRVIPAFSADQSVDAPRFPVELFAGCDLVLMRLPKALDYLSEFAQAASAALSTHGIVVAAERTKYMTPSQNEVLATYFQDVSASLGKFKSRAVRASVAKAPDVHPLNALRGFPRSAFVGDVDLEVVAHGGVFAGTKLDIGTRVLVENLDRLLAAVPQATDFVDSGCGTGVLSAYIARSRAQSTVVAVDVSAAAVRSTRATAIANGVGAQVQVLQDDALESLEAASADVVVCNPPFHTGTALDTDVAARMFRNAGRALRPGGQLWTVYNSPLPYKSALHAAVGPTRVVATNRKFTVTVSTKQ